MSAKRAHDLQDFLPRSIDRSRTAQKTEKSMIGRWAFLLVLCAATRSAAAPSSALAGPDAPTGNCAETAGAAGSQDGSCRDPDDDAEQWRRTARISHISPAMGPPGTRVTVHGRGLARLGDDAVCRFGPRARPAPALPVSDADALACVAPWRPRPGPVAFTVVDLSGRVAVHDGGGSTTFVYADAPRLVAARPGTVLRTDDALTIEVEVRGGLDVLGDDDDLACRVGPTAATAMERRNASSVVCHLPHLRTPGLHPVELRSATSGTAVASSSRVRVRVLDPPRLLSLEPAEVVALARGGIRDVLVKGEGISRHDLACAFDGDGTTTTTTTTRATYLGETEVLCRLPPRLTTDGRPTRSAVRLSNGGASDPSRVLTLTVLAPPSLAAVVPSRGRAGTRVTVRGTSFSPRMACQFGGRPAAETLFVNATAVRCRAPADDSRPGTSLPVALALDGTIVSTGPPLSFACVDLAVRRLRPAFGDVGGGTRVTVDVGGPDALDGAATSHWCVFGEIRVPARVHGTALACASPPAARPGPVRVGVSVDDEADAAAPPRPSTTLAFEYTRPAVVTSVSPRRGPEVGGTAVALVGSDFARGEEWVACHFGDVAVAGRRLSRETLQCETPMMKPGTYPVKISLNGVDLLDTGHSFEVYPRMTAWFVRPSFGGTEGGTAVAVYGTNFRPEDRMTCRFAGVPAEARYLGTNLLECPTPSMEIVGLVDLIISSDSGDTALVDSGFTFYTSFHISSLQPSYGPSRGGTDVRVNGKHFSPTLGPVRCMFGDTAAEATVLSEHQVSCTAPPSAPRSGGLVDFALTHGSDTFALPAGAAYEYEEEITLDALVPGVVPSSEARLLTIHGARFRNRKELGCRIQFGSATMEATATFVDDSQILCRVPQGLRPGAYVLGVTHNGQDFSDATLDFRVIDPLLVQSISPKMGSPDAVPVVSLWGSKFRDVAHLACLVDGTYIVPSRFVNATLIRCSLPLNVNTGSVSVALAMEGVPVSTGPPLFFTFIDLSVVSIRPTFGDVTGGTRVVFDMKNETLGLDPLVSHCIFGNEMTPAMIRQSELMCVSPPMPAAGPARVGVSVDGVEFSMSHLAFQYAKPAVFSSMDPRSGSETGGTPVKLSGANLVRSNQAVCYFGNIEVAGRWADEKILCETPSMRPGNYKVRISLNGVDALRIPWHFTFFKEIDVVYASPSSGSVLGGTEVSIIGKSFALAESLACHFGDWGTARATFLSSTKISCITPDIRREIAGVASTPYYDTGIHVSMNGVDVSSAKAQFQFTPVAIVSSIYPSQGSVGGGTIVTVKGSNLLASAASNSALCVFGNETVPATPLSTEEMTCISPPHHVDEAVSFAVSLNGVDVIRHGYQRFHYLPVVKHVSIKPSGGPFTGGTLVTVTGINFGKSLVTNCRFGAFSSDGIVHISDNSIQCKSPPHPPGTAKFALTTEGDEITPDDVAFEFYKPPTLLFSQPTSGPHAGETVVRIFGQNFRWNVDYLCYFGLLEVPGQIVLTDRGFIEYLQCSSPRTPTDGKQSEVDLLVAEKHSNFTTNALSFLYVPPVVLDYLRPRHALFEGGDTISIFGNHLNTTGNAWCRFMLPSTVNDASHYYETVEANLHDGNADCQVPAYSVANTRVEAFIEVSTNDCDWSDTRLSFVYAPMPEMHGIQPQLGSVSGGTVIRIRGANFLQDSNLACVFVASFGSTETVPAKWRSPEEIACAAPAMPYPVNATVSFSFETSMRIIKGNTGKMTFTYHRDLSLGEASPMRGFVGGGTVVTVRGTGFLDVSTLSCHFGDFSTVQATFISSNLIRCASPPLSDDQDVDLKVSLNGIEVSSLSTSSGRQLFRYDKEIDLFQTIPHNVPASDANTGSAVDSLPIIIIGSSFKNTTQLACLFGEHHRTVAQYISESKVKCILREAMDVGEVEVRISLNGADFSRKKTSFYVVEPAQILSVSPQLIQEGHAIDVLVQGEYFLRSSDLQCHFGLHGNLWSPARWISDSSLKCRTPSFNLTQDRIEYIGVSNNGGHDTTRQLFALEVTPRVRFLSLHPAVGYVGGGTEVTIRLGLGNVKYMADIMCQFASQAAPATLLAENTVVCQSPPYHPAEVTVKLVSNGVHILATGTFAYVKPPIVNSLEPSGGPLGGGTDVSLYGTRLGGVTHCRFAINDDLKLTVPARVQSDVHLVCNAPRVEESVDALVEVTHNGKEFIQIGHVFNYRANPRLLSIAPSFGGDMGGKVIHIMGENFVDALVMCRFGFDLDGVVNAMCISSTLLSCIAPPLKIGLVPVFVSVNGVEWITNESLVYQSIKLPQIQSIDPVIGTVRGMASVAVRTTLLYKDHTLACHFDEQTVLASYSSPHLASCTTPRVYAPSVVSVSVSVDGERQLAEMSSETNRIEFTYVPEPQVVSISPNFGLTRTVTKRSP